MSVNVFFVFLNGCYHFGSHEEIVRNYARLETAESGIGVDVSVIAVVNKTISGVFYRFLFFPAHPSLLLFTSFPRSMWHFETRAHWCESDCSLQGYSLPPSRNMFETFPAVVFSSQFISVIHCYIHYACSDDLFLFTALFVCAFFVGDRTSTTMHGTSRSTSRCRTFGVTFCSRSLMH